MLEVGKTYRLKSEDFFLKNMKEFDVVEDMLPFAGRLVTIEDTYRGGHKHSIEEDDGDWVWASDLFEENECEEEPDDEENDEDTVICLIPTLVYRLFEALVSNGADIRETLTDLLELLGNTEVAEDLLKFVLWTYYMDD